MNEHGGKKFFVNVEGKEFPWEGDSITVNDIRRLGEIPADQSIVEELADGTERTLAADETVDLKPGHRFGRAPRYKRG
jgi:hypothetical protein